MADITYDFGSFDDLPTKAGVRAKRDYTGEVKMLTALFDAYTKNPRAAAHRSLPLGTRFMTVREHYNSAFEIMQAKDKKMYGGHRVIFRTSGRKSDGRNIHISDMWIGFEPVK